MPGNQKWQIWVRNKNIVLTEISSVDSYFKCIRIHFLKGTLHQTQS
jgi:hypothetical protein